MSIRLLTEPRFLRAVRAGKPDFLILKKPFPAPRLKAANLAETAALSQKIALSDEVKKARISGCFWRF